MIEQLPLSDGRTVYRVRTADGCRTLRTREALTEAQVRARLGLPTATVNPSWPAADDPIYTRDPAVGQARLNEILAIERATWDSERQRLAAVQAEVDPLRFPLDVTYVYRRHARGGGEMGPYLRHLAGDGARERIRVLVHEPTEGMDGWLRGQGLAVEPWPEMPTVPGAPDIVRTMLYTEVDRVEPPDGAALVGEKVNIKPFAVDADLGARLDAVTALSPAAREMLAASRWRDCPVVPYGVASWAPTFEQRFRLRAELGIPPSATVAIWCGRMQAYEKGQRLLRELIEALPTVHWLVVGYFQRGFERYREDWARWIEDRSVSWVEDAFPDRAHRLCAAANFAVSTSTSEGLSLALVDAAAAGLPVVASDSGGSRHVVVSGATGRLTPHEDDGALLAAVRELATATPDFRQQLGDNGRRLAELRFNARRYADRCACVDMEALLAREARATEPPPTPAAPVDAPAPEPCEPPAPPASADQLAGVRLCWFFDRPVTGGLLWRAAVLAAVLRRAGAETRLAFGRRSDNDILDWARAHGVPVTTTPEAGECDIVHVGWPPIAPEWAGDAPLLTWVAGRSVRPLLERDDADRWARLVLVHESMTEHVPERLSDRGVVIHNAVPPEWYGPGPESQTPTILCVGRWNDPTKRLEDVCAAVEDLPGARWILAGPVRAGYVPAALRAALSTGRVRWLPRVSPMQMPAVYRQATIYWQPSENEGYPVAALEAQAAGLALVVTDTGGSVETIAGGGGYVVAGYDDGVERLRQLLSAPAKAQAMGRRARAAAAAGGRWARYVESYVSLYAGLMEA